MRPILPLYLEKYNVHISETSRYIKKALWVAIFHAKIRNRIRARVYYEGVCLCVSGEAIAQTTSQLDPYVTGVGAVRN